MAEDEGEVDVNEILARLNAAGGASEDGDTSSDPSLTISHDIHHEDSTLVGSDTTPTIDTQELTSKIESHTKKESKAVDVYTVRDQPEDEVEKKKRDILVEHADVVNVSPSIMSEPEKYLSLLESQPLKAIYDSVRTSFANSSQTIVEKQKGVMEHILRTREHSNLVLNHYLQKNMSFSKLKPDEMDKKMQEVKVVVQEAQKVKHYLLMLIKRLEDMEEKIDNLMAVKAQKH